MFDQGWHTTINPYYYLVGLSVSYLSIAIFIATIIIIIFKIKPEHYQPWLNKSNFFLCILVSVTFAIYVVEMVRPWYAGDMRTEELAFFWRAMGPYAYAFLIITWLPLFLTLVFWKKKYRLKVKLTLVITFLLSIGWWIEWALIIIKAIQNN